MTDLKQQIKTAVEGFSTGAPRPAARRLLNVLGYDSGKTDDIEPNTWEGFREYFPVEERGFKSEIAKTGDWRSIDIVFQLTDEELKKKNDLFSAGKVDNRVIHSYLFLALSLSGQCYSRTDLVKITREINKLTPMPAMLFFRYGDNLTIAAIDRRLHKRDKSRDVLEKVTLIKDISTVKPHRAHVEILHDLALESLSSVATFVELHNAWRKVLSSTELNKRFYREVANWYFWAVKNASFPKDAGENEEIRNATSVIRLITRLIFVWFLKEKGLIPEVLFDKRKVNQLLHYEDNNGSTYYKAILQNLFFATLNTEMGSRKFRGTREQGAGRDQHYGIPNVLRYERYFSDSSAALAVFAVIPFLNGGLFECLDDPANKKRIDGFSDRDDNELSVPDYLFFSEEREEDLNEVYGTKNKKYKVRGIVDIFDNYKFTVNENTPVEEEVALDPELLGKVFENLLAAYNPETGATARKQTGSFYTPREIVNYMVDEALIAYLESRLTADTPGLSSRLRHLLSYTDEPHRFTPHEADILIDAIDRLKILDIACGSGAFPMGILHKLVFILGKLDPCNEQWKARQIARLDDVVMRDELERIFRDNYDDYGRKLYLIENCIYGVDIQPIAVQIAKLRFFISLVVDQKADANHENLGIRPLPNLETRFVAANSLIGVNRPGQQLLRNRDIDAKEAELRRVRERHFTARTPATKRKWREEDERLRAELGVLFKNDGFEPETAAMLSRWDPYSQNTSADFFDPEWMFGITDGFDITIGNPPYVRQEAIKQIKPQLEAQFGKFYCGTADLYTYFYKRGLELLKTGGHLCFIAPNKFMRAGYGRNTRVLLTTEATPKVVIDFGDLPIFDATTYPSILLVEKSPSVGANPCVRPHIGQTRGSAPTEPQFLAATFTDPSQLERLEETLSSVGFTMPASALKVEGWNLEQPEVHALMEKLRSKGKPLGEYVQGRFYRGVLTGLNEAFVINEATRERLIAEDPKSEEIIKPWLRGRDIRKWKAEWAGLYLIFTRRGTDIEKYPAIKRHLEQFREDLEPKKSDKDKRGRKPGSYKWFDIQDNIAYYEEFEKEKIVFPDIAQEVKFTWDESKSFLGNTAYIIPTHEKWLLGLLNSQLIWWFYLNISSTIRGGFVRFIAQYMEQLPIFPATDAQKALIIERVRKILANPDSPDVPRLEAEIDRLVCDLYGLTAAELTLVLSTRVSNQKLEEQGE